MRNCRKITRSVLWAIAGTVFVFSAFGLCKYQAETNAGQGVVADVVQAAIESNEEFWPDDADAERAPISVDFAVLLQQNADVVAWLYCPDTPINYPVVQAEDNSYYLHRLINGESNPLGSLFLDYRNSGDFSDTNSVIYGHNMKNDFMFGTLADYKDREYYEQHPVMYLLTPENDYKVELLAACTTTADSAIYDVAVSDEKTIEEIMDAVTASTFAAEVDWQSGDVLLTLSTCSYECEDARYMVMGVLKRLVKS